MSETRTPKVRLDWSRLLGFDQAGSTSGNGDATRLSDPRLAKIGVKLGRKEGRRCTA
jgi:hypothetical protein